MNKTEEYIINESQEISMGESPHWTSKITKPFPAFKKKDYQLYFVGQLISLVGSWLQTVAQGWLVLQLTHSALWVGIIFALNSIPVTIFVLFGGVIVDRFSKTKLLILTQVLSLMFALILGILALLNIVTVLHIAILTFLLGTVTALDLPARQAFMSEIVDKDELASAIALNAGMFNAARVIGPLLAGLLISQIGIGGAFLVNAVSFIPPAVTLFYMHPKEIKTDDHPHPLKAIKEGLTYSFTHVVMRDLMIFAGLNSIFGWSYITIMPVIAQDIFHMNADGLSLLYAASGLGAVVGTILVSALDKKINPAQFILGGVLLFGVSLLLFSFTGNIFIALPLLFLSGVGLVAHFSMITTSIQHLSPPNSLGRVLSIYTLMFLGLSPLGSFQIGFFAQNFGAAHALQISAVVILLYALFQLWRNKRLRTIRH